MADAGETVSLWEQGPGWDRSLAAATLATAPVAISGLITIAKTRAPASRSNDQIACTRVGSDPQREIRCRDALRHRARVTAPRPRSQAFLRSSCGHHQAGTARLRRRRPRARLGCLRTRAANHAARAISATRSHVVAVMLARVPIRPSHPVRLPAFADNSFHSGVIASKSNCGATCRSASEMLSPAR